MKKKTTNLVITEKKEKQYVRQIIYINQLHLPTKFTPDIDFIEEPVVQRAVPVLKNTFVDDLKSVIKMINNRYK